jgi:hypothetical protein
MPRIFKTKKFIVLAAIGAVAIGVAAFGAYAYFSSSGTGTGTASVGASSAIALSSPAVGTLYPGGPDVPVTVSIHNPGSGNEYVGTISGTVADNGTCQGSWFTVDPITYNTQVAAGATTTASTHVRMTESGTNQDACQSKTVTINWSSN